MTIDRRGLRMAMTLDRVWSGQRKSEREHDGVWNAIGRTWDHVQALRTRQQSLNAEWAEARSSLAADLRGRVNDLVLRLNELRVMPANPPPLPTLRDWLAELDALRDEFGNVEFPLRLRVVRVTTEPITLKDIELGPFAIELHLDRLAYQRGSACFQIVALRPNPAKDRAEVTHPHVNDGDLCAGDAAMPIERALLAGRISDAFLLIRAVLRTYNPGSPYVALDVWDGEACSDCGGRVNAEYSCSCEGCHRDYCDGCTSMCRACEESRCTGCLEPCTGCEEPCCGGCLERIARRRYCPDCRGICNDCDTVRPSVDLDVDNLCPACREQAQPVPEPEVNDAA